MPVIMVTAYGDDERCRRTQPASLWLLIPALFGGFFILSPSLSPRRYRHLEDPDANKGLATGRMTMSQRVAVTVGIPLPGSAMVIPPDLLTGIHLAIAVDVLLTPTAVLFIPRRRNRPRYYAPLFAEMT